MLDRRVHVRLDTRSGCSLRPADSLRSRRPPRRRGRRWCQPQRYLAGSYGGEWLILDYREPVRLRSEYRSLPPSPVRPMAAGSRRCAEVGRARCYSRTDNRTMGSRVWVSRRCCRRAPGGRGRQWVGSPDTRFHLLMAEASPGLGMAGRVCEWFCGIVGWTKSSRHSMIGGVAELVGRDCRISRTERVGVTCRGTECGWRASRIDRECDVVGEAARRS